MMVALLKASGLLALIVVVVLVFAGQDASLEFLHDTWRVQSQIIGDEQSARMIEDTTVCGRFIAALQAGYVIHDRNRYQVIGLVRCYAANGELIDTLTFFDMADAGNQVLFSSQRTERTYASTRIADIMDVIDTEQFPEP